MREDHSDQVEPIDYHRPTAPVASEVNWHRGYLVGSFVIGMIHLAGSLMVLWWLNNSTFG